MDRLLTNAKQAIGILDALIRQVPVMFPDDSTANYVLSINDAQEQRTKLQNRYLYGWVYKQLAGSLNAAGIAHPSGEPYTPALVRLEMMVKLRIDGEVEVDGQVYPTYKSTAKMGKREFTKFIEDMNRYYIEKYQVGIPAHEGEYYHEMAREIGLAGR